MRAALVGTIVATCAASMATPASADVKAGVDAWQQGDYAKAIAEWRPMAAAGDADAQFNLGQSYKLGRGVPADVPVAMEWFRKASVQGHQRAYDNLGLLMFQQGKREEAMPFIRKSAERGEPRAQYILGTAMFNGDLVLKDWVMAYALMTRAASSGLEQATTSLTTMDKYISTEQRQKGLSLAADMGRTPKGTDFAVTSDQGPVSTPRSAPTVARPALVQTPPRQVANAAPRLTQPQSQMQPQTTNPDENGRELSVSRRGAAYDDPPGRSTSLPRIITSPPPSGGTGKPPQSVAQAPPASVRPAIPPGDVTPRTNAKPSVSGGWRVQMGAFRETPRAKALWEEARSRVAGLSGYKLFLVPGGDVTRVQAGPLQSEADAARLCGKLRAAGYTCLPRQN